MVNYNYFATELCENKNQPELECNGKCHLAKELAKTSENDNPIENKQNISLDSEVLFFQEYNTFNFTFYFENIEQNTTLYSNLYGFLSAQSFFHPPSC